MDLINHYDFERYAKEKIEKSAYDYYAGGANMRKIRLAKCMSQDDICRKPGVDRAYISNIEGGKKNHTLATIEKIAKALEVSTHELIR